jgi:hypothetical protein
MRFKNPSMHTKKIKNKNKKQQQQQQQQQQQHTLKDHKPRREGEGAY